MSKFRIVTATCLAAAFVAPAWSHAAPPAAAQKQTAPAAASEPDLGLTVPDGFKITRYADDKLAHNIFSMTLDSAGHVVVSGPGYVKVLIDTDGDGQADRAQQYADGPETGAQGMYFLGRDLLCTGDAGLIKYADVDGDSRADGPPEVFLKIKTGGEHNAHAIRRGPDGWWYLLVGNTGDVNERYITTKKSCIKYPHGGVLMRLKPDLSGGEVLADGFRNAYDFDFNANGEFFVYDSDGEKELSLPWYLPTRLFHVLPGGEHGWITDNWKRPDNLLDSAPVAASTGRGSPTGVICYRHDQFPPAYRNGMFVLDWTFGRVFYIPMERKGSTWTGTPQTFITSVGQHGFAPTDIELGIDGALYICVGGRGTQGTVYRVAWTGAGATPKKPALLSVKSSDSPEKKLVAVLQAPHPMSSWSRTRWLPLAREVGPGLFHQVILDEQVPAPQRLRAIEIVTELFNGLTSSMLGTLSKSASADVRARAVWGLSVQVPADFAPATLQPYLDDRDALVRRHAAQAVWQSDIKPEPLILSLAKRLNDEDRLVRLTAAKLIPSLSPATFKSLSNISRELGWKAALTNSLGFIWRNVQQGDGFNSYAVDLGRRIIEGNHPTALKLEAVRVIQIAMGDLGPADAQRAPAYDGYTAMSNLAKHEKELNPLRVALAKVFPTGDRDLDIELSRVAAMTEPLSDELLTKFLAQLTTDSAPVDDLHYLAVIGRMQLELGPKQTAVIARVFVGIDRKISDRKLLQDNSWNERVGELYARLVEMNPKLPEALLTEPGFGRPAHVLFLSKLPTEQLPKAIECFAKQATSNPDYVWNNDIVFVLGHDKKPEHFALIRERFERFELRMAVLMTLASDPQEIDRLRFAEGLDSGPIEVLSTCVAALEKLPAKKSPEEFAWLVKLLRRLGTDKAEFPLREQVVKLLERNSELKFPFKYGEAGHVAQPEAIERWTAWVTKQHPEAASQILGGSEIQLSSFKDRLQKVVWARGDEQRGRKLFESRGCAQCHSGAGGLGPDLAGSTGRFSREDLFVAIAAPNLDVSPRYQTMIIETKAGKQYTGLIVYEAVDGLLLRNGANQTFRIEAPDIEMKRNLPTSLMPNGLLKDLKDPDLADLYKYLQSLSAQTAEASSSTSKK